MAKQITQEKWEKILEEEANQLIQTISDIKKDEDVTSLDILKYTAEIVDAVVYITEASSKIIPNWDKDKKDWAVKLIDKAIDLGKFHPILGTIDKTNVDRIFISYLVDAAVKFTNEKVGKNWDKVDTYIQYAKMVDDILQRIAGE